MTARSCDLCGDPFRGRAGYLVTGAIWRDRWVPRRLLICAACFGVRTGHGNLDHARLPLTWVAVSGRGVRLPPTPCVRCAQPVIRNDDPLLLRIVCSHACGTAYQRRMQAGETSTPAGRSGVLLGTPEGVDRLRVQVRLERALLRTAVKAASRRDQALDRYLEHLITLDAGGAQR
ncbi:hypothetical protein ACFYM0_35990 [Streptomyces sp. NPDC006487]|uniref:hypothetical protein n=1 Tax=Streptomyces sp. NPDC006487 TaxID=3364748 RepID=UPI0036A4FAC6